VYEEALNDVQLELYSQVSTQIECLMAAKLRLTVGWAFR
jgi:hypothetical protein